MVTDSDLDFNQRQSRFKVDRSKVNELGLTMQSIGDTLATAGRRELCQLVQFSMADLTR